MCAAQCPCPLEGSQPPAIPEAGSGAPSWSTEDKPLSSEQLEPTYRKGSECWSEGTGRGSSRVFLGTPRLKFVLETEEKIEKLLWADLKGCLSPTHNSCCKGTQAQPCNLPQPPCPAASCPLLVCPPPEHKPTASKHFTPFYIRLEATGATPSREPGL